MRGDQVKTQSVQNQEKNPGASEILDRLFLAVGVSKANELAEALGKHPSAVTRWKNAGVPEKAIREASLILGIRGEWLKTGKGEMRADGKIDPVDLHSGHLTLRGLSAEILAAALQQHLDQRMAEPIRVEVDAFELRDKAIRFSGRVYRHQDAYPTARMEESETFDQFTLQEFSPRQDKKNSNNR